MSAAELERNQQLRAERMAIGLWGNRLIGWLIDYLFSKAEVDLDAQLQILCESQAQSTGVHAFYFRGEVHLAKKCPIPWSAGPHKPKPLHARLYPYMQEYEQSFKALEQEKKAFANFVGIAYTESDAPEDLYKLLPECLHGALKQFLNTHSTSPRYTKSTLTAEQAQAFVQANAPAFQAIKERALTNLLMAGIK